MNIYSLFIPIRTIKSDTFSQDDKTDYYSYFLRTIILGYIIYMQIFGVLLHSIANW